MPTPRENLYRDENFQSQSLNQLREWIDKDMKIKKCRTDTDFLLKFLRTKNFSIPRAFQLLVNYYSARKSFPNVFENLDATDPDLNLQFSNMNITILPEADVNGSPVVFYQAKNFDTKKITIYHTARAANLIFEIISCNPKSQINGITHIYDATHLTLDMLGIFGLNHVKEFAYIWQDTLPLRHRAIYLVNLPTFATAIINMLKKFLSEKLQSRIKIVNGWEVIHREVGASILPEECGGELTEVEIVRAFKRKALELREEILAINDFEIELNRNNVNFGNAFDSEHDGAITGSFRKLQVD